MNTACECFEYRLNQTWYYGIKNRSNAQEATIRLIGIEMIIFGSTLTPFVSSSKNLSRPALDAGSGAFFFLSAMPCNKSKKVKIKTFLI